MPTDVGARGSATDTAVEVSGSTTLIRFGPEDTVTMRSSASEYSASRTR
jgi:hypothetical protein